jgi:hypothetical protein
MPNNDSPRIFRESDQAEFEDDGEYDAFLEAAYRSRDEMLASGMAYDGDEFFAYIRARVRGESPERPKLKPLESFKPPK